MRDDDMLALSVDAARTAVRGGDFATILAGGANLLLGAAIGVVELRSSAPNDDLWVDASGSFAGCIPLRPAVMRRAARDSVRHPLFRRSAWVRAIPHAARVSDHVDLGEFRDTDLYRTMHGPLDGVGRFPSAVHLGRHAGTVVFLAITRRTDLSDTDMEILDVLVDSPLIPALAFRAALVQATRQIGRECQALALPTLTDREAEVLGLVALGWTDIRIGRHLRISERTVRKHLEHVNDKLGTTNRAAAVHRWHARST